MFVACDGVFLEKEFLLKGVSRSKVQLEEIRETPKIVSAPTKPPWEVQDIVPLANEAPTPRRSTRACCASDTLSFLTTEQRDILLFDNDEPKTYKEAVEGPDSDKWLEAKQSKLKSMHDNQVWNLVDPIKGMRPV